MAAVLCQGVGSLCNGVCECVGAVCKAPFQICGTCCKGIRQCCSESCQLVTNCCSTSFCCYITVTCLLNLPPIVVGLMDVPNLVRGGAAAACPGSLWLLIFWLLCAVNIIAAFYMSVAVQKDSSILPQQQSDTGTEGGGLSRVKHLFCYDMWMAVYILVLMGFFGWLCLGVGWFVTGTMDDDESCDDINQRLILSYSFGWAWIFCGGCSLCLSLCCVGNDKSPSFLQHRPSLANQTQQSNTLAIAPNSTSSKGDDTPPTITASKTGEAPSASRVQQDNVESKISVPASSAPSEIPVAQATLY